MTINGEIEENRLKLYRYFPVKKDVQLRFETDSRDVLINGAVELISCDIFSAREVAQISIICPQPYFRAVNDLVSYFSDTEALFEFPFSIDKNGIEISRIERNIRKSIINTGETETGIIIQLYATGEVVNPIIYDVDEKTYLKLNYTMQQDDEIEDTRGDTELCGWVTGLIEQLSTTTLFEQWTQIFSDWFAGLQDIIDTDVETKLVNALPQAVTVTLPVDGWSASDGKYLNTVTVPIMNETKSVITYVNKDTMADYVAAGITCKEQGQNSLTFEATAKPTAEIKVDILHMGV